MKKPPFLKKVKTAHLVGIKGVAMTAMACCLQDLGIVVTGSDVEEKFVTDKVLKERQIKWRAGFSAKNIKKQTDLVITTAAHGGLQNPEVIEAQKRGISGLTHAEALGKLMEGKRGISVCGVGGKTTVSAMLATAMSSAKRKPSYAVGVASLKPLGFPGKYDLGSEFVAEADEYATSVGTDNTPRFMFQNPDIIVATNIEYDHPDIYRDLSHTKDTFREFFTKLPATGLLVGNYDNDNLREVISRLDMPIQTYGFSPGADWRITKVYFGQEQTIFDLAFGGGLIDQVKVRVPGKYNVLNAAAVFAVGTYLGIPAEIIKTGLWDFLGTRRRFELIGEVAGIRLYDDYAHHPEEIKATLAAAKFWFPERRLVAVFQPHTYSRTKALLADFSHAFTQADVVLITDIYASAREQVDPAVSGRLLALETKKNHPKTRHLAGETEVIDCLSKTVQKGDIVLTMGAGDIFHWHKEILKALKSKSI